MGRVVVVLAAMAKRVTTTLSLIAVVAVCVVLLSLDFASAARGGGSRGGGSSSRGSSRSGSSSYRSSSSSSTKVRTRVSVSTTRVRYGTRYYVVAPSVHIYGYTSYKSRHLYASSRDDDPTVCYSEEETGYNGTALGYFVCPMADDPDSYNYCCGDDDEQYCCDFWGDSGRAAGAVIGILFGVAVLIAAVVVICKCCCQNTTKLTVHKHTVTVSGATACESVPLNSMPPVTAAPELHRNSAPTGASESVPPYSQPYSSGLPYPPQPAFDPSQASAGPGLPYPMSPPNYGLQPATDGAGYPQPQPYGPPTATSSEPKSIGFEGVAPELPGSSSSYPSVYPPVAQQQVQPPPYSDALRM